MKFRHGEGNVCARGNAVEDGGDAFGVNAAEEGVVDGGGGVIGRFEVFYDLLEGRMDLVEDVSNGGTTGGAAVEVVVSCAGDVHLRFWWFGVNL